MATIPHCVEVSLTNLPKLTDFDNFCRFVTALDEKTKEELTRLSFRFLDGFDFVGDDGQAIIAMCVYAELLGEREGEAKQLLARTRWDFLASSN